MQSGHAACGSVVAQRRLATKSYLDRAKYLYNEDTFVHANETRNILTKIWHRTYKCLRHYLRHDISDIHEVVERLVVSEGLQVKPILMWIVL